MIQRAYGLVSVLLLALVIGLPAANAPLGLGGSLRAAAQAQEPIAVAMNDIFFDQRELIVGADTDFTIRLSNEGVVQHNFSIDALGISVDVAPGMSEDVVVNAPAGTYEYSCNVPGHREAGMVGRLTVEAGTGAQAAATTASGVEEEGGPEATISALQTEVARLQSPEPTEAASTATPPPTAEVSEEAPQEDAGAGRAVNVELILDVSGSMGQVLATGETRMDAAKRVLDVVLAAIPDRPGINVGLRIYGHEGDNTEAGQAVSCQSSELTVPVEGVDKALLEQQISALQPTGWTPIALSLQRAAADFPSADDDAVNAVVLVTDGLETCGGDPAAVAGELRQSDIQVITHVVGFALTAEEQQLLAGIADRGEGLLLGANTADELSEALFSVLEELEIVAGAGYVGGNAFPLIPAGASGEVSVVTVGGLDSIGRLPFVVRNNTSEDVVDVKVAVIVRDAAGILAGRADSLEVRPNFVPGGGLAFGYAYFGGVTLPPDVGFELEAEATPADEARFTIFRDLDIAEAALFEDRIVGVAENGHDGTVLGPFGFGAVCFDLEGNLLGQNSGTVNTGDMAPGDTEEFQVTVNAWAVAGAGCPAFLVAGSGISS